MMQLKQKHTKIDNIVHIINTKQKNIVVRTNTNDDKTHTHTYNNNKQMDIYNKKKTMAASHHHTYIQNKKVHNNDEDKTTKYSNTHSQDIYEIYKRHTHDHQNKTQI